MENEDVGENWNFGIACTFSKNRRLRNVTDGRLVVVNHRGEPYLKIFRVGIHRLSWSKEELSAR